MPPRSRPSAPAEARHARTDAEICPDCWPEGWPQDTYGATCAHGTWTR